MAGTGSSSSSSSISECTRNRNPFSDSNGVLPNTSSDRGTSSQPQQSPQRPSLSSRASSYGAHARAKKHKFVSYRLRDAYEQPWLQDKRLKAWKRNNYIIYGAMVVALGVCGFFGYWGTQRGVPKHDYCLVLEEDFSSLDPAVWNHEVQVDGFGTGSFDWTTDESTNSFVDGDGLHIVPTLTTETSPITPAQILDGYALNLTQAGGDGTCTGSSLSSCSVRSNTTTGAIINPVRSARLNTKGKKSIKYGRVEVVAKLPKGDWLWPAIWMMPEKSVYGQWPASGEIDIMEAKGNDHDYPHGRDYVDSTLHWGPTAKTDAYLRTTGMNRIRRTDFSESYHTYGLEWSEKYLFTYRDTRLRQVLYWSFDQSAGTMWQRGYFSQMTENNTLLTDPWSKTGRYNTPFDEDFYLVLNVAVGSRNGWFTNNVGGKPWIDADDNAMRQFWQASDQWLPTWGEGNDRGMTVKSVRMWQEKGYNGC
ncbi:glycosyl hydrolase [Microdochium trichocladiopsis]|uniref:Glycosyl hydrolase n=1 Tax=Microdochium trichocladiopsis TaxID=1682393 RepID=A0A9P8Y963_9PEZI|nr:glycosyl hydrolase [Microdochium trichocladiopsis]KAH7033407.1 glycosyl hydrolase [Microdochium trichocladiopsis]